MSLAQGSPLTLYLFFLKDQLRNVRIVKAFDHFDKDRSLIDSLTEAYKLLV